MYDASLQSVAAIEPVFAVQHQRQVFLEFSLREGREETQVPEIYAENRDVSAGDRTARPEQCPVSAQCDQEIDRLGIEVHALGPFGCQVGESFLEGEIDLVITGEAGQSLDTPGNVMVLRTPRDADTPQTGSFTDHGTGLGLCRPPAHADSTAAATASCAAVPAAMASYTARAMA